MEPLFSWVKQVGTLLVLVGALQFLLPNSGERQAARLAIGLVIVLALLEPLGGWIAGAGNAARWQLETYFPSGEEYIKAGAAVADRSRARAEQMERERSQGQLAALLTLIDGVRDAQVHIGGASSDRVRIIITGVESESVAASGESRTESTKERIEAEVRAFARRMLPQVSQIEIEWRPDRDGRS